MSSTASPRTLRRTLHVMVLAGAVGLAAAACAPAGTPTAVGAPAPAAATDVVTHAAPTTTEPATPSVTAPSAAPSVTALATTAAATPGVDAAEADTPTADAPTASARPIAPDPVSAKPVPAAAGPVAPAPMAVVVPVAALVAAPAPGGDGVATQAARAVFDATNTFRQRNGAPALVWDSALQRSAHQHNLAMAAANEMTHQAPGEASFDTRISDQGVPWLSVGENVGFNTERTVTGALALHTMMINEVAPNDGHKVNKLDPLFTNLGVDIYLDAATGKLWLTEDYAQI